MESSNQLEESYQEETNTDFVGNILVNNQVPVEEQKEILDNTKEEGNQENEKETTELKENIKVSILEKKALSEDTKEEEKLDNEKETTGKKQAGSLKKASAIPKLNHKSKPTVPKPFSLSADKRMSRDGVEKAKETIPRQDGVQKAKDAKPRQDGVAKAKDAKPMQDGVEKVRDAKPRLSKFFSLNMRANSHSSVGAEQNTKLRHGASVSSRSILVSNGRTEKQLANEVKPKTTTEGNEVESKKSQASVKDDMKVDKLRKSSTFKASPLPSFYHKRDPPSKLEVIKIPVTCSKSPPLGQRSKSLVESEDSSKGVKEKRVSKAVTAAAKETINKLIRGTWKAPSIQPKLAKSMSSASIGAKIGKKATNVAVHG